MSVCHCHCVCVYICKNVFLNGTKSFGNMVIEFHVMLLLLSFRPEEAMGHSGVSWLDWVAALKSFTSTSSPDPKAEPVQPVFSKGSPVPGKFVNSLMGWAGLAGWMPPTITFPLLLIQQDLYKCKWTKGCITCVTYTASLSVLLHRQRRQSVHICYVQTTQFVALAASRAWLAGCDAWWSW